MNILKYVIKKNELTLLKFGFNDSRETIYVVTGISHFCNFWIKLFNSC